MGGGKLHQFREKLKKYKEICLKNKGEMTGLHRGEEKHFGTGQPGARRQRCTGVTGSPKQSKQEVREVCVCMGHRRTGGGAQQPYLARSLLVGGGVREGEAENSPGCSGIGASIGGA